MEVEILEQVRVKTKIDVQFPIYRIHDLDSSTIYTKVESPEREISIHYYHAENKFEFQIREPSFYGSIDYMLGMNEYKSDEGQFLRKLEKCKQLIFNT